MTAYDNIKKYAKLRGMSLQEVAEKSGLSKNMLYQYKHMNPKIGTLTKIAETLNVSKDDLLGGDSKTADLADDSTLFTYQGKPIDDEDKEIIRRLLRGK